MTALSVNLNKVALLRNQRDSYHPSVIRAAEIAIEAGADGLTVHPRQDERHITPGDVSRLADFVRGVRGRKLEYNIEGYPSEDFMQLVEKVCPDQVTLVPDAPGQLTSDHGWDLPQFLPFLQQIVARLRQTGSRVALFADAVPGQIPLFAETGAQRVELYTGPYAANFGSDQESSTWNALRASAIAAQKAGLGVNAGHDLNLDNLGKFLSIPGILEVSIGHYLMSDALTTGLSCAVRMYKRLVAS